MAMAADAGRLERDAHLEARDVQACVMATVRRRTVSSAKTMAIRKARLRADYAMGKRPASTRSTASRSTVLRLRLAASRMAP